MRFFTTALALFASAALAQLNNAINVPEGQSTLDVTAGQPVTITWSNPSDGTVTIKLQQSDSDITPDSGIVLSTNTPASAQTFTFTVNPEQVNSYQYTIEIIDNNDPNNYNFSPNFGITNAQATSTDTASSASGSSSASETASSDSSSATDSSTVTITSASESASTSDASATDSASSETSSDSDSSASATTSSETSSETSSDAESSETSTSASASATTSAPNSNSEGGAGSLKIQGGLAAFVAVALAVLYLSQGLSTADASVRSCRPVSGMIETRQKTVNGHVPEDSVITSRQILLRDLDNLKLISRQVLLTDHHIDNLEFVSRQILLTGLDNLKLISRQILPINHELAHCPWASGAFAAIFALSACLHLLQSQTCQCWVYTWPLVPACLMMTGAFICREVTARTHEPTELSSAVQGLFYAAMPTFALPLYFFLLRILETPPLELQLFSCHRHHLQQGHHRSYASIFFIFLVTFLNSALIGLIARGASTYFGRGHDQGVMAAGLRCLQASQVLQLVFNVALLAAFTLLRRKHGVQFRPASEDHRVATALTTLALLTSFLLIHNGFRTLQIFASPHSGMWLAEVLVWVLEGTTMVIFTGLFHIMHPALYLDLHSDLQCSAMRSCVGGTEEEGITMDYGSTYSGDTAVIKTTAT
ncbi:hypothetical protein DV738_g252, partial [Chaetothyriales sp. CBS 135597]